MNCPVCDVPLIVVERHKIELDYCISCKGIWFDSCELNLLYETLGLRMEDELNQAHNSKHSEGARNCPLCDSRMMKITIGKHSSILLDRCTKGDGIWFDERELSKIVNQGTDSTINSNEIFGFLGETFITNK